MNSRIEPLLSVCIPYYQGQDTIERCVSSVFAQTIGSNTSAVETGEVEVVICSDDSSPDARAVLLRLAATYKVRVKYNAARLGLTGNWQAALSEARGKIVTLLHQDDWYAQGCLKAVAERFEADGGLVLLGVNALLDGNEARPQLQLEGLQRKGRQVHAIPDGMKIVFAPSCAFMQGIAVRSQDVLYDDVYTWSPERELYYNLARDWPGSSFAFDPRPLVCRGLSDQQFSITNEDGRVLDLLSFWERNAASDAEKAASFGDYFIKAALDRMIRWVQAGRATEPESVARGWRWLAGIYRDPRFLALIKAHPERWDKYLGWMARAEVDLGPLGYECLKLTFPDGPEKVAALGALGAGMQPSKEMSDRALARVGRILEDDQFNSPVLICGFHHSGTRLLAEALEAIGVFQHAPSPTHEWSYIQQLNTLILPGWMTPADIDAFEEAAIPGIISRDCLALRLSLDGYVGAQPWGHKDPRNSITAKAWLKVFPRARIVNIVRNPLDALGTLAPAYARYSPGGLPPQREPAYWASLWRSYLLATRQAAARTEHAIEVSFEDLCSEPLLVLGRIIQALDLDCSVEPGDIAKLDILPNKIGAHAEWLERGDLAAAELETLRKCTADIDLAAFGHARRREVVA